MLRLWGNTKLKTKNRKKKKKCCGCLFALSFPFLLQKIHLSSIRFSFIQNAGLTACSLEKAFASVSNMRETAEEQYSLYFTYIPRWKCTCYWSRRDLVNVSSHAKPERLATNLPNFEWRWGRVKSDGTRGFRWALICPDRFSALSSLAWRVCARAVPSGSEHQPDQGV